MERVLIANRGEIACRIIRSCKEMGLHTVAVYSDADANALHVEMADDAFAIGPADARKSYLNMDSVIAAAIDSHADAVHPGYGFLSENASFADAVERAGKVWVGPDAKTIIDMGDKERARSIAESAGVPVLPGSRRFSDGNLEGIRTAAEVVGYPLLVKASAGGGGIGMKQVRTPDDLEEAATSTMSMAQKAFGDDAIFLERYIPRARHIEVQVFGYGEHGAIHLYERDCSIQRRFQKIIEESPAPGLPDNVRARMTSAAVKLCEAQLYSGAGTVEFIVDASTFEFFFLEMNTRIQVEHPVTEMCVNRDLVAMQIEHVKDHAGQLSQDQIDTQGHAIECRIYAENPQKNFMPSPGKLIRFDIKAVNSAVRIDTGYKTGDEITFYYDPMIAKVIAHGETRDAAIKNVLEVLEGMKIEGPATNVHFLIDTLRHLAFRSGNISTSFVDDHRSDLFYGS